MVRYFLHNQLSQLRRTCGDGATYVGPCASHRKLPAKPMRVALYPSINVTVGEDAIFTRNNPEIITGPNVIRRRLDSNVVVVRDT